VMKSLLPERDYENSSGQYGHGEKVNKEEQHRPGSLGKKRKETQNKQTGRVKDDKEGGKKLGDPRWALSKKKRGRTGVSCPEKVKKIFSQRETGPRAKSSEEESERRR